MGEDVDDASEGGTGKRKKVLILALGGLLVLIGAAAAVYLSGMLDGDDTAVEAESTPEIEAGTPPEMTVDPLNAAFVTLDEMLVALRRSDATDHYLAIEVALELADGMTLEQVEAKKRELTATFNFYLRGLNREDFEGSEGLYRLRQELLPRAKAVLAPVEIDDILFRKILVQ